MNFIATVVTDKLIHVENFNVTAEDESKCLLEIAIHLKLAQNHINALNALISSKVHVKAFYTVLYNAGYVVVLKRGSELNGLI